MRLAIHLEVEYPEGQSSEPDLATRLHDAADKVGEALPGGLGGFVGRDPSVLEVRVIDTDQDGAPVAVIAWPPEVRAQFTPRPVDEPNTAPAGTIEEGTPGQTPGLGDMTAVQAAPSGE